MIRFIRIYDRTYRSTNKKPESKLAHSLPGRKSFYILDHARVKFINPGLIEKKNNGRQSHGSALPGLIFVIYSSRSPATSRNCTNADPLFPELNTMIRQERLVILCAKRFLKSRRLSDQ